MAVLYQTWIDADNNEHTKVVSRCAVVLRTVPARKCGLVSDGAWIAYPESTIDGDGYGLAWAVSRETSAYEWLDGCGWATTLDELVLRLAARDEAIARRFAAIKS